ncbi:biogenesis of lysosome-related organelles complex 1 subunit 2 [Colias croceus]|uniref:biogenesis of lysosome-related organelles complex 1 subunit 2 n=1 Tax=Colias crocea TaxID=72248 RepID=UPI001E280737|nr:biogenesis of lysosome-related organelles complex 1 subunit 2 [Colias croceus]XP_045510238.1 biogenesis of lysosome-related organelles complex 1 subunit 2 [Colias croceus]XP_045510239.1 biogenesis of lysosome-related organelles complex 1 subunit 2 [Colias croceus]XP_045510240.1 biogenesis of lysosome-related organelles complex 1 subunit 2 [Colias croceus]
MSEEEKWSTEEKNIDLHVSPSCSSFEVLDPHDPVISRLATQLFKRTNDYLQGEMSAGQDHYVLLEEINRLAITKYADLKNLTVNLTKTLNEYNEMYETVLKPLLSQIDDIDAQVSQFEASAYSLDSYTKQLKARFKELEEK